jgi:uncharacterized FlaG/YvyC family protein
MSMDNETDSFDVQRLNSVNPASGLGLPRQGGDQKKHENPRRHLKKEARDYFHTLDTAAEATNEVLKKKALPYRFHVYREGEEVFIDVVALDEQGRIIQEKRKNISHDDFERLIEDVSQFEGLFFDGTA